MHWRSADFKSQYRQNKNWAVNGKVIKNPESLSPPEYYY